ncbi:MAG TPA: TlpA disulfide reductase family protein [Methylomirabilota bacterium]|nr:TlpA disulfide reductase family protein [Methylomirabilota bacterium]
MTEPAHRPRPTRPIAFLLTIAVAVAAIVLIVVRGAPGAQQEIAVGQGVPNITGTTLDGAAFDLSALRGRPVIVNFWKPTCVPCRTEFPLLAAKATEHAAQGLVIVGVMSDDPIELARAFAAQYGSSWSSVIDAGGATKRAYRVLAWPQTYFVDRQGVLRSIQYGEVTEKDFERQYATISGGA